MDCPKCDLKLTEGTYADIQTFLCESCTGILFKQKSLITVIKKMSLDLFSSVSIYSILPEVPDKLENIKCPECKKEMEQYGYMGSKKVTIDNCNPCNYLWLDANELAAMAKMYVRSEKNREHLNYLYRGSDIVGIHIAANFVPQLVAQGFIATSLAIIANNL